MPGPRPRLTVAGLMALVALTALVLGGALGVGRARQWALDCRMKANDHALRATAALRLAQQLNADEARLTEHVRSVRELAKGFRSGSPRARRAEEMVADADRQLRDHRALAESAAAWAAWHSAMRQRYERAVSYPWNSLAAEPSRPLIPEEDIDSQVQ
ncbi:MAG: hypothetical protein ABI353_12420 [Isosphaeraceae bacterium]